MDSLHLRPDCRRFVCDRCGQVVYICSWCDHGQRYCSDRCRRWARRRSLREAGRRHQRSRRGRVLHARRQAAYRCRQQASEQKVTHHSCRSEPRSASVSSCMKTLPERSGPSSTRHVATQHLTCHVCGHPCEPFVRDDYLRCRRPRSERGLAREVGDDFARGRGRDPTSVHHRGLA